MTGRARRRSVVALVALVAAGVVAAVVVTRRPDRAPPPEGPLAALGRRCAASVRPDGVGVVALDAPLVARDETAEIPVPCRVELGRGASIVLERVRLRADHLAVGDDGPNGRSWVSVISSTISGAESSGFSVDLADSDDSFSLHDSTVDFGLSVLVTVHGVAPPEGGGRIEVTESVVRSRGPGTRGIALVASERGGTAVFSGVTLDAPEGATRLLFAGTCRAERVTGAPARCSP